MDFKATNEQDTTGTGPTAGRGAVHRLDHRRTISRHLAQKRRLENVLITSLSQADSPGQFLFAGFVPQSNAYLNDLRSHAGDMALSVMEIGRQAGMALSLAYLGMKPRQAFVLDTMIFESRPLLATHDWRSDDRVWGEVTVDSRAHDSCGDLQRASAHARVHVGRDCVCTQAGRWRILPSERYLRLRNMSRQRLRRRKPCAEEAPNPGPGMRIRLDPRSHRPVLAPELWASTDATRFAATLVVDSSNLFFFDHGNDHVPGMLVLEGMRTLALDIVGKLRAVSLHPPTITRISVGFKGFAELDAPIRLIARLVPNLRQPVDSLVMQVEVRQFNRLVAIGEFAGA